MDLVKEIFVTPLQSAPVLILSLVYFLVESVRIYDTRLIQAETRGMFSAVAFRAEGYSLPPWIGYLSFVAWGCVIGLVILNWKYALAFYSIMFLLKVVPVLERIGEVLARPALRKIDDDPFY